MSEKLTNNESARYQAPEEQHRAAEQSPPSQETTTGHQEKLGELRKAIEHQADTVEKAASNQHESEKPAPSPHHATKQIKQQKFNEIMMITQKHLKYPSRQFSKLIHNKNVEAISEVGAATIARPSGILGGSIIAIAGSIAILMIARQVGFRVPSSVFVTLFIIGFFVGIFMDAIIRAVKKIIKR